MKLIYYLQNILIIACFILYANCSNGNNSIASNTRTDAGTGGNLHELELVPNDTPAQATPFDLTRSNRIEGMLDGAKDEADFYVITAPTFQVGDNLVVTATVVFEEKICSLGANPGITPLVVKDQDGMFRSVQTRWHKVDLNPQGCAYRLNTALLLRDEKSFYLGVVPHEPTKILSERVTYAVEFTYGTIRAPIWENEPNDQFSIPQDLGVVSEVPFRLEGRHDWRCPGDKVAEFRLLVKDPGFIVVSTPSLFQSCEIKKDYFRFTLPQNLRGAMVVIQGVDASFDASCSRDARKEKISLYREDPVDGVARDSGDLQPCPILRVGGLNAGSSRVFSLDTDWGYAFTISAYSLGTNFEIEPNDTLATATDYDALQINGLVYGYVRFGDVDWYKFQVTSSPTNVTVEIVDGIETKCTDTPQNARWGTMIQIYNAQESQVGYDFSSGVASCSKWTGTLGQGTYYVRVVLHAGIDNFDYNYGIKIVKTQ